MSSAMDAQSQELSVIIEKLISKGINNLEVQDRYVLPPHERPLKFEISHSENIPVIDLKVLDGPNRTAVVHQIRRACEEDGFFQVVSNERFKNVEHIAVKNMHTTRLTVPTFHFPSDDAFIALATSMVTEQQPAVYRAYKFEEFMRTFWNRELKGKSVLDSFRI